LAYIRQLCCSGLSKEIVIAEFLRAVQIVIPSGSNSFSGCDDNIIPSYHILEFVAADLDEPIVIANYLTSERRMCFVEWFKQHAVLADATVFDESFYMSDMYNLVSRRYDQHHILWALVKQYSKTLGMLTLYRPRPQKPFNNREQALLTGLLPYIAHALQAPDGKDIQYSANGFSGMMIMDTQGAILYLSSEAQRLLALACHPVITVNARIMKAELLDKLAQLCQNLGAVFRGQSVAPPTWSYTAANGRFIFRAQWLEPVNHEQRRLIGMTVEHQEPDVLRILRGIKALSLSPMQMEVCLMLAQNHSQESIAQRLHIKPSTAKDHIRKIYLKLDIHQREDLVNLLSLPRRTL